MSPAQYTHIVAGPRNESYDKAPPQGIVALFDEIDYLCYAGIHVWIADIPALTF